MMTRIYLLLFAVITAYLGGCAANPVTGKQDFVLMSEEQEINLGRQAHQQILKQYKVYDDPELQEYVNNIVEELSAKSHRDQLLFHATVLDSPQVNAFALPGGYVYITRGIMAYMNSEAEMAGVLGHEIGHVTARHGVRQQSASQIASILSTAAVIATGSRAIADASNIAGTALLRGYGREHELEADRLGAEYLAKVGYDPQEMINVVGILKSQEEFDKQLAEEEGREPRAYHGLFSTHPANDLRLQEVIRAADKFRSKNDRPDDGTFLKLTNGMTLGQSEREGVIRGNKFYHNDLNITITFPQGWKIDNLPDRLIASTKTKDAVMQISLRDLNKRQTPKEFIQSQFGDNLRNDKPITTESFKGYTAITKTKTPFGNQDTRIAALFKDKQVFQVLAAAKDLNLLKKHDKDFLATVNSIRKLRSNEKELAKARKIKVITAKKGDTFATLAKNSPLTSHAEEQLRLLNGLYPDGEPTPGKPIKIVE
ncbi:MAG: M48 family metalloprotease [Gammaproteobacteria bacterium]|nr:M48 family metalloprotease [Gammaproteobacteria bacterium]